MPWIFLNVAEDPAGTNRNEQGSLFQVVEAVYGWRLVALIDLVTLIPPVIRIVQILVSESPYRLDRVRQAQNLFPLVYTTRPRKKIL